MIIQFTFEKTNRYKGVLYLHGWQAKPYLSDWLNISLRRYDQELPPLFPGMLLSCKVKFIDRSAAEGRPGFATYELLRFTRSPH